MCFFFPSNFCQGKVVVSIGTNVRFRGSFCHLVVRVMTKVTSLPGRYEKGIPKKTPWGNMSCLPCRVSWLYLTCHETCPRHHRRHYTHTSCQMWLTIDAHWYCTHTWEVLFFSFHENGRLLKKGRTEGRRVQLELRLCHDWPEGRLASNTASKALLL